jgi:hypothetical protein
MSSIVVFRKENDNITEIILGMAISIQARYRPSKPVGTGTNSVGNGKSSSSSKKLNQSVQHCDF